jgi:hypothetical protein
MYVLRIALHSPYLSSWLYSPLLGLGHFFSFLILHTVGRTPWTGDQASPYTDLIFSSRNSVTLYFSYNLNFNFALGSTALKDPNRT